MDDWYPRDRRVLTPNLFDWLSRLIPGMSKILKYPKVTGERRCFRVPSRVRLIVFSEGYDLVEQIGGGGFST